tara:strand:- start:11034 stop:11420 length:387 start_codon:yes stop_codon:yes gene_type:complete
MLEKNCDICSKLILQKNDRITCDECMNQILKFDSNISFSGEIIETKDGLMKLSLKSKNNKQILEIKNKKFRYSLYSEEFSLEKNAKLKFIIIMIKLKKNRFKIIRNIEALDENYRRVFSRIKYGILFL